MSPKRAIDAPGAFRWARNIFAVVVSLAVIVGGGWFVADKIGEKWASFSAESEDYTDDPTSEEVQVTIPEGATGTSIAQILVDADVVKTKRGFIKEWTARESEATKIQVGTYKLRKQLSNKTALSMLLNPENRVMNSLRLADGKWLAQQVQTFVDKTGVPAEVWQAVFKDPEAVGVPDWNEGKTIEGYLFPDTYDIPLKGDDEKDETYAKRVVKQIVSEFKTTVSKLDFATKAKALDMTPYQALILASIIEKETGPNDEDRPKIARAILNRMKPGSPTGGALQLDSTVQYANYRNDANPPVQAYSEDAELCKKSAYNTYPSYTSPTTGVTCVNPKYKGGFPPGPIASPSEKSLEAAVNPAEGDWYYFMVVNLDTGEIAYASTQAEHEANNQKLQAWCAASAENHKKCFGN